MGFPRLFSAPRGDVAQMSGELKQVGEKLREARENRGLTLAMAEDATKIRKKYLEALEEGRDAELPGEAYTKGFIRTYGNFLGLDGAALVREFKSLRKQGREQEAPPEPQPQPQLAADEPAQAMRSTRSRPRRSQGKEAPGWRQGPDRKAGQAPAGWWQRWVPALVVALLGLAAAWLAFAPPAEAPPEPPPVSDVRPDPAPPPVTTPEPAPSEPATPPEPEPVQVVQGEPYQRGNSWYVPITVTPGPIEVTLTVREGLISWYQVRADGRDVVEGTWPGGSKKTYTAQERLEITLGHIEAVNIEVNGQDFGHFKEPHRRIVVEAKAPEAP